MEVQIRRPGRLHQQQLVETDPGVAVGKTTNRFDGRVEPLVDGVDHHEVIAQAVHLGEFDEHGRALVYSAAIGVTFRGRRGAPLVLIATEAYRFVC